MSLQLIAGRFGGNDIPQFTSRPGETATLLELSTASDKLDLGIGKALEDLRTINIYPSEIGIDLMIFSAHVYAADTRINRDTESEDSWTREIRIIVPVSDMLRWNTCVPLLERQLNFLTGDLWKIEFRQRPQHASTLSLPRKKGPYVPPIYEVLNLFSGGLDSLIGAIDALSRREKILCVSHAGDAATSAAQNEVYQRLVTSFPNESFNRIRLWMNVPSDLISNMEIENTTRGRSFLFFSLGVLAGTGLNKRFVLRAPENGLIALNVPLDTLRLGSLSTRTTHPFYMDCWNKLLTILGVDGKVENPYWNKTKGEMAADCLNASILKELIPRSLSCASPAKARWSGGNASEHCGYCLPCLIRRAALRHAFGPRGDRTPYTLSNLSAETLNTNTAEGKQVRSFQLAIKRLRDTPSLAGVLIHKPGPLPINSNLPQLAEVYARGMNEVAGLLHGVRTKPL